MMLEWRYRSLLLALCRRWVGKRYRGTWLGMAWAILLPLLMLGAYTLVFEYFLKVRWPGAEDQRGLAAALRIYLGLLVFNYLAENLSVGPGLVIEQVQFVKKIVFPLPLLAPVAALTALIPLLAGLMVAALLAMGVPDTHPWRVPLLVFHWLPVVVHGLAIQWWLGSLGVYFRDLGQLTGPLATLLLFLGPVFYARENLAWPWSEWLLLNPLTVPVEAARQLLFGETWPAVTPTLVSLVIALVLAVTGRWVFVKIQVGFADVL